MTRLAFAMVMLSAGVAQAHPGHLIEVAGHGHWLAAGAAAAAIALAAALAAKGRKAREEAADDAEDEALEEAAA